MVALSRRRAKEAGVADRATFVEGDMFEADISKATVLALFLLPSNLDKLAPKFLTLKPGTRIVNNTFQSVIDTFDVLVGAVRDTIVMSIISLVVAGIIGLALGLALYATRPGNLLGSRTAYTVLNVVVNLVRPIPFVIFLAAIAPLSRVVVQTTIGVPAVTFAISLAASFAVSRIVEQNLLSVDPGVVEAARASGAHPLSILLTVLIPEGLGPLISVSWPVSW